MGEVGRERNIDVRKTLICCPHRGLDWAPNPQPFGARDDVPTNWDTPNQTCSPFLVKLLSLSPPPQACFFFCGLCFYSCLHSTLRSQIPSSLTPLASRFPSQSLLCPAQQLPRPPDTRVSGPSTPVLWATNGIFHEPFKVLPDAFSGAWLSWRSATSPLI